MKHSVDSQTASRRVNWRSLAKGIAGVTGLPYFALLLYATFFSEQSIFVPRDASYQDKDGIIKLRTADGNHISARYLPNPQAAFTILYSHGNGDDLGRERARLRRLHDNGFAVFAYDYQGYGTSQGQPSEHGTYHDIDAAYRYLTQTLGVAPERVIVYGRSVGGGPSTYLAARRPVGALVLESTFTTAFRVVTQVPLLPFDRFENIDRIRQVRCPVLVIHGKDDRLINIRHGKELYQAAPTPKRCLWVNHAGHCDVPIMAGQRYDHALRDFSAMVLRTQEQDLQPASSQR